MNDNCAKAATFLEQIFASTGLNLRVAMTESPAECLLDLSGPDSELLQAESGELLLALQHLVTQAFARTAPEGQRLVCDVDGYRATREAELRAMANLAADRVRQSRVPFVFGEMNASERRVIHLALADSEDLQTESVGEGSARKLRIALKSSS
ncbi:MAG TPA: R3H domain-containing nucleic acid-binding protein [Pyrinomonadaceae bacterium]|nr:R3H domain-containing nucleic acid-binding protein [Pyrinomonadaceae bacterium]